MNSKLFLLMFGLLMIATVLADNTTIINNTYFYNQTFIYNYTINNSYNTTIYTNITINATNCYNCTINQTNITNSITIYNYTYYGTNFTASDYYSRGEIDGKVNTINEKFNNYILKSDFPNLQATQNATEWGTKDTVLASGIGIAIIIGLIALGLVIKGGMD